MFVVAGPVGEREHECAGHPERPAQLTAAMAGVHDLGLGDDLVIVDPAPVGLDPDTDLAADSWETALRASVVASLGALVAADVSAEPPTAGGPGEASRRAYDGALS